MIHDERLPVAPALLGAEGLELAAAVAGAGGGTVASIQSRQALYSPGRSLAVNYHARMSWPDREPTEQVVAALADGDGLPEDAPARRWGGGEVAVWRFPHDPVLKGLEQALDESLLADLLGHLDLEPRRVEGTPLVYRPTRRALVRLSLRGNGVVFHRDPAGRVELRARKRYVFLKVVKPAHAEQIGRLHAELDPHLPIPRCHGIWNELGLLALEGLPGLTLRDFIRLRDGAPPPAEHLLALLDALPAAASADRSVRSMRRRVGTHERLLRTILPDHEERIRRLGGRLQELPSQRPAVVHGDFYDSQILVDDTGAICGLVDLDGVGRGDPADDLASMLGRVWTSGQTAGRARERFAAYAGEILESFSQRVDRRDLCLRVAAIVFGRATGPFRNQFQEWRAHALDRIELAERCLEHARRGSLPAS
ncbi:MAG: phosphotransferase family protein [Thermoleophilaceae bacterium]